MIINIILIKSTIEPKNSVVFFIYTKTGKRGKKNEKNNLSTKLLALPNRRFSLSCTSKVQKSIEDPPLRSAGSFAAGWSLRTFR